MAAGPSSLGDAPQPGGAPPDAGGGLVGPQEEQAQSAPSDQQQQNRNFTSGVKNLHKQLDDFARQYPDMSDSCDKAKNALTSGMVRHMASSGREGGIINAATPTSGMIEATQIDWARMAAYIDGEGCIGIYGHTEQRRHMTIRVCISNSDPALPMWCKRVFGGRIQYRVRPSKTAKRPCYRWCVADRVAIEILKGCLPYFIMKSKQAEIAIDVSRTTNTRGTWKKISDEEFAHRIFLKEQLHEMKHRIAEFPVGQQFSK